MALEKTHPTKEQNIPGLTTKIIYFTFGALCPIGACGPRRDLIAKRMICLLTKINNNTNTCTRAK